MAKAPAHTGFRAPQIFLSGEAQAAGGGGDSAAVPAHELMVEAEIGGDLVHREAVEESLQNISIEGFKLCV